MKKGFTKNLLSVLLIVSLIGAFVLTGCGNSNNDGGDSAGDKTYEWKLQSSYGPGDQTWDIQMPMIVEAIEKATDGKVKITTFQPSAICEPEQAPQSVKEQLRATLA